MSDPKPQQKTKGLTDAACRNAGCPHGQKHERYADSGGLYLEVTPRGSKRWFWKYRFASAEKRLALGSYPAVSLRQAREARDEAKVQLKTHGKDPAAERRLAKLGVTSSAEAKFEPIARAWWDSRRAGWSKAHADRVLALLKRDLFPDLGGRLMHEITPAELLAVLNRRIVQRGSVETADRARMHCSQIWRHAMNLGIVERNIAEHLGDELPAYRGKHFGAITDPRELGELLRALRSYGGGPAVRTAIQLLPLVIVRPGELAHAEWSEFDLDGALWTVPAVRMKRRVKGKEEGPPHLVPLSRQAVALLQELKRVTGNGRYVFPSVRGASRPMSRESMRAALITLGYDGDTMTMHGFRATARTMLDEQLHVDPGLIEAQLAHATKNPLGRAYDRAEHLKRRADMMQVWADFLDERADGAQVIEFKREPVAA